MANILETIESRYDSLTRKQREIADYMRKNPVEMCFITLKELSGAVGVSEMTVLNLCGELGYRNFNEVKNEFRIATVRPRPELNPGEAGYGIPEIPEELLKGQEGILPAIVKDELANVNTFLESLPLEDYCAAAGMICAAETVILCGRGVSLQLIDYLQTRLIINEIPCVRINTELYDDVYNAFSLLKPGSLLIAVSFPDYYYLTSRLISYSRERGIPVLGLTDGPQSPVVPDCTACLFAPSGSRLYLNSMAAPVMMADLLTSAVAAIRSGENRTEGEDRGSEAQPSEKLK